MKLRIICINPTMSYTENKWYEGEPVRQNYWGGWKNCGIGTATCFRVTDDYGCPRIMSKKRFKVG